MLVVVHIFVFVGDVVIQQIGAGIGAVASSGSYVAFVVFMQETCWQVCVSRNCIDTPILPISSNSELVRLQNPDSYHINIVPLEEMKKLKRKEIVN